MKSGLNPLKDVKEVIILARELTVVDDQLLVLLLVFFLQDFQLVLGDLQIVDNPGPNIADGGQQTIGTIHEVMILLDQVSPNFLSKSSDTYPSGQRPNHMIEMAPHNSGVAHGLGTLVVVAVLVGPIVCPCEEELEQNWIGEILDTASVNFFGDTASILSGPLTPFSSQCH